MPVTTLPERAAQYFINQFIVPDWDATNVVGFDPSAAPGTEAHLGTGTTLDDVGAPNPSLVIQFSTETSGGETTYDYVTGNGPAQRRDGQLVATARCEVDPDGYTGDSGTYSAIDADELVTDIVDEVERICLDNPLGDTSEFGYVGSQRGPDAPDDRDADPTTRLATCTIVYGWLRA